MGSESSLAEDLTNSRSGPVATIRRQGGRLTFAALSTNNRYSGQSGRYLPGSNSDQETCDLRGDNCYASWEVVMDFVGKALWYIEANFEDEFTLDDVAAVAGLSKFHLSRAFEACFGKSVIRYARERRLSEAAKRLAVNGHGILDVALQFGYNSHEAFTRAFKAQFGVTPDAIQRARSTEAIKLVEAQRMDQTPTPTLPDPRIASADAMLLVGLKRRYSNATSAQIPAQWQTFRPYIDSIKRQTGNAAFGVLCNSDDEGHIDYLTAVAVSAYYDDTPELDVLRIPPQTYAVFIHDGHVSDIRRTWKAIFGMWSQNTKYKLVDAPQFERYGENFDPETGNNDIEIWIPVH